MTDAVTHKILSIKDFLALPEDQRPKLLKEETVTVPVNSGMEISVVVKQLSKSVADHYQRRVSDAMPDVPMIEHQVRTAQKNPDGTVKPAGTYKEANPKDPSYLRNMELWFNDACTWLVIYCIADSLEIDVNDPKIDAAYTQLSEMFPPDSLLNLGAVAAKNNPGLPIAEQIMQSHLAATLNADLMRELDNLTNDATNE